MKKIEAYIKSLWEKLTRTTEDVSALVSENKYGAKNYLFVSAKEDFEKISKIFSDKVEVKKLPEDLLSVLLFLWLLWNTRSSEALPLPDQPDVTAPHQTSNSHIP